MFKLLLFIQRLLKIRMLSVATAGAVEFLKKAGYREIRVSKIDHQGNNGEKAKIRVIKLSEYPVLQIFKKDKDVFQNIFLKNEQTGAAGEIAGKFLLKEMGIKEKEFSFL